MAFEMLRKYGFAPISPERVGHFESKSFVRELSSLTNECKEIRKTQVPRYLFRAFTSTSGGGQHYAINNVARNRASRANAQQEAGFLQPI